jgi:hypothetical protein
MRIFGMVSMPTIAVSKEVKKKLNAIKNLGAFRNSISLIPL